MVQSILNNLLSNAIKFTPRNGNIKIEIDDINNMLKVSVKDSGIGLSEEQIVSILEKNNFKAAVGPMMKKDPGSDFIYVRNFYKLMADRFP